MQNDRMKKAMTFDSKVIDAVNARAKTYRILSYLMHVYGPTPATKLVADSVQECHEEAIRLRKRPTRKKSSR